jgi:hypothetical protein
MTAQSVAGLKNKSSRSQCTGEMAKIFFLLITMKLASLVEIAMLIIYHQGKKENF